MDITNFVVVLLIISVFINLALSLRDMASGAPFRYFNISADSRIIFWIRVLLFLGFGIVFAFVLLTFMPATAWFDAGLVCLLGNILLSVVNRIGYKRQTQSGNQ